MKRQSHMAIFFGALSMAGIALFVIACEDVTGLDLAYHVRPNASDAGEAGTPEGGAGTPVTHLPCPCDQTEGLGCCLSNGASYCAQSDGTCGANGPAVFVGCERSDPTTESLCCWTSEGAGAGATALTGYAADCGARAMACVDDSDCAGEKCNHLACDGVTLGVCGAGAMPACPSR